MSEEIKLPIGFTKHFLKVLQKEQRVPYEPSIVKYLLSKSSKIVPDDKSLTETLNELLTNKWIRIEDDDGKLFYAITEDGKKILKKTKKNESKPFQKSRRTSLDMVHRDFKKWLHLKDEKIIDLLLAISLLIKNLTIPIWLIVVATSGAGKTELLRSFEDKKNNPAKTFTLRRITQNTLITGNPKAPDLVPMLKGKLVLTFDFAQFLKLDSDSKAQIWSQLRDLYDGFAGRQTGSGVNKEYTGIKFNWGIASTPSVDTELLIHQTLGTRELIYRLSRDDFDERILMEKVWNNTSKKEQMRIELNNVVRNFINCRESENLRNVKIDAKAKESLFKFAKFISQLRASAEVDAYSGELTNFTYPEMPTRVLEQLKQLFIGLKNLDRKYSDEQALAVIKHISFSSIHPVRLKILLVLLDNEKLSTTQIQKEVGVGWKTVYRELNIARQLELVRYEETQVNEGDDEFGKSYKKKEWLLNKNNEIVKFIVKLTEKQEDIQSTLNQMVGKYES